MPRKIEMELYRIVQVVEEGASRPRYVATDMVNGTEYESSNLSNLLVMLHTKVLRGKDAEVQS